MRSKPELIGFALAIAVGVHASLGATPAPLPLSPATQYRYERLQGQIQETADHGRASRVRTGIALGAGGTLLLGAGLIDAFSTGSTWVVSSAGISYAGLSVLFLGLGVGTFFAVSPEEHLAQEVLLDEQTLSPEQRLAATEERLRGMARAVRKLRVLGGWYGVGLAAAGGALYALNSPSSRGIPVVMIVAGVSAALSRWAVPSEAERLWGNYVRDYGIEPSLTASLDGAAGTGFGLAPGLSVSWRF